MRSMLLGAHEALISSNAWLVDRLKTVEVRFYRLCLACGGLFARTPSRDEASMANMGVELRRRLGGFWL